MQDKLLTLNIPYLKEKAKEHGIKSTVVRARRIIKILERDNYKCVKCNSKDNLTIDHINGRKFAKHDNQQKYRVDKCQVLCVDCHLLKNQKIYKV